MWELVFDRSAAMSTIWRIMSSTGCHPYWLIVTSGTGIGGGGAAPFTTLTHVTFHGPH